ncbi:hypothetical protein [Caulobacter sp. 17J65-9]|uniref:hypothetical protein n=1 Tax=Caulobacter sp. 17J65-9 TaxID=2709382 RepID=UPI0013C7004C|nr:hypothetical protein [Caulobacter sp. 17J65-9]NEX92891.1 hypothetical protein [Caulobacter sp. 17J65-9]
MGAQFLFQPGDDSWATCSFEIGDARVEWFASRLSDDAFGDLISALAALLRGGAAETTTVFVDEPECLGVTLAVEPPATVRVTVTRFPDWPLTGRTRGEVIFDEVARLRTLAGSVVANAQSILATQGAAGYLARWGTPFPDASLAKLRAALDEPRGR